MPGDERLLVLPFLESRDHVRLAGEDRRDEARNVFRLELEVGGIEHEHVAARGEISRAQRVGDAAARAMARQAQERVLLARAARAPATFDRRCRRR